MRCRATRSAEPAASSARRFSPGSPSTASRNASSPCAREQTAEADAVRKQQGEAKDDAAYAVRVEMAHVETYRLKDGRKRYRARWIGIDGASSARATFALKKDADLFVLEQQRRASLGALFQAPPETLGEFSAGWLDRYALRVRASTRRGRTRGAASTSRSSPPYPLDEIRPAAVEDHIAALAKRAPRQAELALRLLKQILANAKERGHLVDEGVFRVKAPRREPQEMRFLEWDEVEELAANTAAPYGNMVMLAALTGLRQGELFALRDRNVDLEAKTVMVENGVYKGEFWPVKTRASRRRVDLSATAVRVLRQQLLARKPNELGLVFPSPAARS